MKIYIASSWKNSHEVIRLAVMLRGAGHEVDAFCEQRPGRFVFDITEIDNFAIIDQIYAQYTEQFKRAFKEDRKWLDWADACVLLLPSGRSAHLEAGYAVGRGKSLFILGDWPVGEFDVMYGFATALVSNANQLLTALQVCQCERCDVAGVQPC